MKINIIKPFIAILLVGAIAIPAAVFAEAPEASGQNTGAATASPAPTAAPASQNTGAATAASAPAASGQNTGAATSGSAGTPTASGQNTGAASVGTPTASGQNTGAATLSPFGGSPAASGQNSGAATAGTYTPPSNNNGGGNTNTGGGATGSSGSSGSYIGVNSGSLPYLTNIGDCNYLTVYLKIDKANPTVEVTKLQNFLKSNEGMNVTVTGVFDQATFNAVSLFQKKYKLDVLTPWGIDHSTGFVYYTTTKKINELFCKKNFTLTPAQVKEIEAYRTGIHTTATISNEVGAATTTPAIANATSTPKNDTQVAGAAKASVGSKIWKFIKTIFGR